MLLALLLGFQVGVAPTVPPVGAERSVVLVKASVGGGSYFSQGSGVVVAPGLVATNAHVLRGGHHPVVTQGRGSWVVTEIRTDSSHDLCLLTVPGLPLLPAEPGADEPDVGQVVYSVGFPEGRATRAQGRLLGSWHYGEARLLQSDAPTRHGSSGGGLFDAKGRLLGLTTFIFGENTRLNFSVPIRWVQELMPVAPDAGPDQTPHADLTSVDFLSILAEDPRNWPAWEQAARAWAASNPDDPDAWMAMGLALDKMARRDATEGRGTPVSLMAEAVRCFERSVAIRQTSLRPRARGWNALGVALDTLNRFEDADQAFLQAVRLDPTYGRAWLNLGIARLNGKRYREAAEAFSTGLRFEPDDGLAWARCAYALQKAGVMDEAVHAYVISLRYRPFADELWLELGSLWVRLQRRTEAEGVLARLKALDSPQAARLEELLRKAFSSPKRTSKGLNQP